MKFKQLLDSKEYPFSGTPVIAFLGDSVTHGAFECTDGGSGCVFDFAAVYHNRLRLMISQKYEWIPVSIINAGVAGDTAAGGLQRLARGCENKRSLQRRKTGGRDCRRGAGRLFLKPPACTHQDLKRKLACDTRRRAGGLHLVKRGGIKGSFPLGGASPIPYGVRGNIRIGRKGRGA